MENLQDDHNRELSDQGRPDGFKGWEANQSQIEIELKDEN